MNILTKTMLLIYIINFTSYTQKLEIYEYDVAIEEYPLEIKEELCYILLDINSVLFDSFSKTDSLFNVTIAEINKLHKRIASKEKCSKISIPESLFSQFSKSEQDFLSSVITKNYEFNITDSLFCEAYFYKGIFSKFVSPINDVVNCSLYISSEKSSIGEDIMQINGTAYRIATRADGSKVLRRFQ